MQYGKQYLDHMTGQRLQQHPYFGKDCPTCNEVARLQPYCPDCRDRARMHPLDYRYSYKGPASGNEALERLQEEQRMIDKEEYEHYIGTRTFPCPECDETRFIPEGDYVCGSCRNSMVLGL